MPGLGLGLSIDSCQAAGARLQWSFAAPSAGLIALPSGFSIACATTGRTSQQSAATLQTGYGANAARARNVGNGWGLSVECARTNDCWASTLPAATAGVWGNDPSLMTVTANFANGPDGATTATRVQAVSGNDGPAALQNNAPASAAGAKTTWSCWAKANNSANAYQHRLFDNSATNSSWTFSGYGSSWTRQSVAQTTATRYWAIFDARAAANPSYDGLAVDILTNFWQYERGASYPGSAIPATSAAVTRNADVLSYSTPATFAPGGFFDATMTIAPNYAQGETAADHNLIFFDTNNRLFYQQSSAKMVLRIGGADVLSSALTFARETALTIRAAHTAAGRTLTVSGASAGNGTAAGGAASAISLPGSMTFMGGSSGAEECADLRSLIAA